MTEGEAFLKLQIACEAAVRALRYVGDKECLDPANDLDTALREYREAIDK